MMQKEVMKAYDELIPKDRYVVDIVIAVLRDKDKEIHNLMNQLKEVVNKLTKGDEG